MTSSLAIGFIPLSFSWITFLSALGGNRDNKSPIRNEASVKVIPARFERATHSLEGCCSIQLSYGTKKTAGL
jgi:hypothetical protein